MSRLAIPARETAPPASKPLRALAKTLPETLPKTLDVGMYERIAIASVALNTLTNFTNNAAETDIDFSVVRAEAA